MTLSAINLRGVGLHWLANGLGIAIPILMIPYLIHVLGAAGYGKIALIQLISFSLVVLSDFGLSTCGPKILSLAISAGSVRPTLCRLLGIHAVCVLTLTVVGAIYFFLKQREFLGFFLLSQMAVLLIYFPAPYLMVQFGLQAQYGLHSSIAKLAHFSMVFLLINSPLDVTNYFVSLCIASSYSSLIFLYQLKRKVKLLAANPDANSQTFYQLAREGGTQLFNRASSVPLSILTPLFVEMKFGSSSVAVFALVDKIRTITWQALNPIIALFAMKIHTSAANTDQTLAKKQMQECFLLCISMAGLIFIVGIVFGDIVLELLRMKPISSASSTWFVGLLGVFPGAILAYLFGLKLPNIKDQRKIGLTFWGTSIALLVAAPHVIGQYGLVAAVLLMVIFETVSALIIYNLARRDRNW
jgi:polysaccharide transporter, PST family